MEEIRGEIIELVQNSMNTLTNIENADRQLNGLQTLNLMKRDLARNRIKEALHEFQVKLSKVAAEALKEVATLVKEREDQLTVEREKLTAAKERLMVKLQETSSFLTAPPHSFTVEQADRLRGKLKPLLEADYSLPNWEGFSYLEFVPGQENTFCEFGYLRTASLDPSQMVLMEYPGYTGNILELGKLATLWLNTGGQGGLSEYLKDMVKVTVTGPGGQDVPNEFIERESKVLLVFQVMEEGPYVVDVRVYNVHIKPCPFSLFAIDQEMDKSRRANISEGPSNSTSALNAYDLTRTDESELRGRGSAVSPGNADYGQGRYGPRARRLSMERSPAKLTSPSRNHRVGNGTDVSKLSPNSTSIKKETSPSQSDRNIIQPRNTSPTQISKDLMAMKLEPEDVVMKTPKKNRSPSPVSSKAPLGTTRAQIETPEVAVDETSCLDTVNSSGSYSSTYYKQSEEMARRRSLSPYNCTRGAGDRNIPKNIQDEPPPLKNSPGRDKNSSETREDNVTKKLADRPHPKRPLSESNPGTNAKTAAQSSCHSVMMPSFSFITNLLNLSQGNDVRAELVSQFGQRGSGTPYVFSFPIGLTTIRQSGEPNIIACDTGNNLVKSFSWNGKFLMALGTEESGIGFRRPSAVVVGKTGDIFVKDDRMIQKFMADGTFIMRVGEAILRRPYGLALTNDRLLVTLDHKLKAIVVFKETSGIHEKTLSFPPLASSQGDPRFRFLAVHDDKVIAVNLGEHEVIVFSLSEGTVLTTFGGFGYGPGQFREPSGVTVVHGNVMVADSKNNRIQAFSIDGTFRAPLKLNERIIRPSDIHLTEDGFLLVDSYFQHSIKIFKLT